MEVFPQIYLVLGAIGFFWRYQFVFIQTKPLFINKIFKNFQEMTFFVRVFDTGSRYNFYFV